MLKGTKKVEVGKIDANAGIDELAEHIIRDHQNQNDAVTHHYKIRRQEEISITIQDEMIHKEENEVNDTGKKKKKSWCGCFGK